jgi:phosphoglycolate phosphatase-like HAD superfamily hydrolase
VIKHIIWDFDGTLFDTYSAIVYSFVEVLRREFNLNYAYSDARRTPIPILVGHPFRFNPDTYSDDIGHSRGRL